MGMCARGGQRLPQGGPAAGRLVGVDGRPSLRTALLFREGSVTNAGVGGVPGLAARAP